MTYPKRLLKYEMRWGTYHPKYDLINTAKPTRKRAIEAFCGSTKHWKYWYRQGWRAIRIKVVPLSKVEKECGLKVEGTKVSEV